MINTYLPIPQITSVLGLAHLLDDHIPHFVRNEFVYFLAPKFKVTSRCIAHLHPCKTAVELEEHSEIFVLNDTGEKGDWTYKALWPNPASGRTKSQRLITIPYESVTAEHAIKLRLLRSSETIDGSVYRHSLPVCKGPDYNSHSDDTIWSELLDFIGYD